GGDAISAARRAVARLVLCRRPPGRPRRFGLARRTPRRRLVLGAHAPARPVDDGRRAFAGPGRAVAAVLASIAARAPPSPRPCAGQEDRKSTRLNSSHVAISY